MLNETAVKFVKLTENEEIMLKLMKCSLAQTLNQYYASLKRKDKIGLYRYGF